MSEIIKDTIYKNWILELKTKIQTSQLKAAVAVNCHLINLYWEMGRQIVEKQETAKWGSGFIKQLSKDLMTEFPDMKGFSEVNLKFIRRWYLFYNQEFAIGQQPVTQLQELPWGHNIQIISKCSNVNEALFYVNKSIENGWSRSVLMHQIELNLYTRQAKAVNNFTLTLPQFQSDLANQLMKDPYNFDFLLLTEKYNERDLEIVLTNNITNFLLELGTGFAFVGKQFQIELANKQYFIDLLFYHLKLRCYVVIELKTTAFIPEYAGKLNFYLNIVDDKIKHQTDNKTIGLIICKTKNNIEAEYALRNINMPIGISEYELSKIFPVEFKGSLPTIEEIEQELMRKEVKEVKEYKEDKEI